MVKKLKFAEKIEPELMRLDLGAGFGAKTPAGFVAVDLYKAPGVRVVDLRVRWPWKANSVDEVHCDYVLQYLTAPERVHFANELDRVLKPGAQAKIIVPHPFAHRAYTDIRVQWPPVAESWFMTLSRAWREAQNCRDDSGLTCDFDSVTGYGMHQQIAVRVREYQEHAVQFWKEAVQDIHATLTKRSGESR